MHFSHFPAACAVVLFAAGYLFAPPVGSTAAPETTVDCSGWHVVVSGDTCTSVITAAGINLALFESMNPISVAGGSCSLLSGFAFCIQENFGVSSTSTSLITSTTFSTSTTTAAASTTTTGNGIATPTPFQAGMTTSCNAFHLVVSGDQCGNLATTYGITLVNFYLWNPAVGSTYAFLDLGDYVCVNIIGGSTITTTTLALTITKTTSGNGITTPTPYQAGIVTDCDSFYLIVSGD